jgi:hypothetical protein
VPFPNVVLLDPAPREPRVDAAANGFARDDRDDDAFASELKDLCPRFPRVEDAVTCAFVTLRDRPPLLRPVDIAGYVKVLAALTKRRVKAAGRHRDFFNVL